MALDSIVTEVHKVFCGYYVHHEAHNWASLDGDSFKCSGWAGLSADHKHKLELIGASKKKYTFECTICLRRFEYNKKALKRLLTKNHSTWFVWRR